MAQPVGTKVGSAFFEVVASFIGFGESLQSGVVNAITARGAILGQAMEDFGKKLFTRFTLPFAAASAANIAQFQGLQRSIAETLTLFGTAPALVDETMGAMAAGIRDVSTAVGGLEKDIADGLYQTISAGVPRSDAFEFLEVAQIAAIADKTSDLTTAVDGITTAINAYKLEFGQAAEVSDQFFATVARGKTTFGELSQDLGRVAPLAANAGVELGETLAIIGQLTVQGLKTSEAVSFLRAGITGLLRPTDELNAIFEDVGFSSAEAAVPVLGLQGAFQAVVDAADGSTSKLQELIGTSEGVTAILGVTGDNAANFASILDSVENSSGRAADAFRIVDSTMSRSFGRLTETFDRLGNVFGAMATTFVQPFVDTLRVVLNEVVSIFEGLAPLVETVGNAFGEWVKGFQLPVVRELVSILGSVVIGFGGMLAILGAVLIPLGKMTKGIVLAGTAMGVFKPAVGFLKAFGTATSAVGDRVLKLADRFTGLNYAARTSNKSLTFFGKTLAINSRQLVQFSAGMLGVTAAVIAVTAVVKEWQEALTNIDKRTRIVGEGVDRLAASIGATIDPLLEFNLAADDAEGTRRIDFALANPEVIQLVKDTLAEFGRAKAEDFIIGVGYQFISRGGSEEDLAQLLSLLGNSTGVRVDVEAVLSGIDTGSAIENSIGVEIDRILDTSLSEELLGSFGLGGLISSWLPPLRNAQGEVRNLADLLVQLRLEEGDNAFLAALDQVEERLKGTPYEEFFADSMIDAFQAAADGPLGFSKDATTSIEDFRDQLQNTAIPIIALTGKAFTKLGDVAAKAGQEATGSEIWDFQTVGSQVSEIRHLTESQVGSLIELRGRVGEVLQAGQDWIAETFNTVREGVLSQMPLLGIYGGAIEQSFQKWRDGQEQFREDIASITDVRDRIANELEPELLAAFDQASIGEQAWLAALSPKELETALAELALSFDAVEENARRRFEQMNIAEGVEGAMQAAYDELYLQAEDAGGEVPRLFQEHFEEIAAGWPIVAAEYMAQVAGVLGTPLAGPSIGGITFGPAGTQTPGGGQQFSTGDTTITIYNPTTNSIVEDTDKALRLAETYHRRGRR